MKKRLTLFTISAILLGAHLKAQNSFFSSADAYIRQIPPGDKPILFAPGQLAPNGYFPMDRVAFSSDGKTFYYCTNNTWFSSKDLKIYYRHFDGQHWTAPRVLNAGYYAPSFSPDGNKMFFNGKGKSVLYSIRTDSGWSEPAEYFQRSYGLYDFMTTQSGHSYVGSNGNGGNAMNYQTYDICILPVSLSDTSVQSLGIPVNTPGFDGDFYIAPDESYMIISAKEKPDFECELWISFRKADQSWTNPKSLGPLINDGNAHRWGEYVSPDGKYLFYSHGTSPKDCGILWVRFDKLLEKLKHSNFAPYVKLPIAVQTATKGQKFSIIIPETTFVDDDGNNTLRYTASQSNGNPLPAWLTFDAVQKIISGKAPDAGKYSIKVSAIDPAGAKASSIFLLNVSAQ